MSDARGKDVRLCSLPIRTKYVAKVYQKVRGSPRLSFLADEGPLTLK